MLKLIKSILSLCIFILVLLIIGRLFLFEIHQTGSYSMIPNLVPEDIFLVYKPILLGAGDIAVCNDPENPRSPLALRIIGTPDTTISIKNNTLYINGRMVNETGSDTILYEKRTDTEQFEYLVDTVNVAVGGHYFPIAQMDQAGNKNFAEHAVEDGFFLLGDNRNIARDSRHFGEIPIEDCFGKAVLLLWPAADNGDLARNDRFLEVL
jgi:signal peptidase I